MQSRGVDLERGGWVLGGCVAVFGLPFFIAGTGMLSAGLRSLHLPGNGAPILLAMGLGFTALSVGFVALIWFGMRQAQAAARRRNVNPMQPWLWRDDWAARRVGEETPAARSALWVFALMWSAITIPLALAVRRQVPSNPIVAVVFLFAAIGLVLLVAAAYSSLRRRKFGPSICAIDRLPIEPGLTFSGQIEHRGAQVPDGGYRFVLSCLNRIVTGGGRNRSISNEVLWETEQRVSGALAAPSPDGMRVPFSFEIPAEAPSSDLSAPADKVLWQLAVSAELPGIDYKATFELPVFATADNFAAHHMARQEEAARRELSEASRVTAMPLPSGGIELRIAPQRDAGALTTFVLFSLIWFGAIFLLWHFGAPAFIAAFFSLFGLLILGMAVDFFAGTSVVTADYAGLRWRHAILGMSRSKSVETAQIESIAPKVGGHLGNRPFFDIEARLKDRSSRTVARYLVNRNDADAFAAKLWAALRR